MPKRQHPPTQAEIDLAIELYDAAKVSGTLKAPRAVGVLILKSGYRFTIASGEVTYNDYLADARRKLKKSKRG